MAHALPTAQTMATTPSQQTAPEPGSTQAPPQAIALDPAQTTAQHPGRDPAPSPAIALTIGGSDSGGGAGIQADLKTFTALKVHGCSALSCITAQNTRGVSRVDALPPEALTAQIEAVLSDLPVAALKTGMLLNRSLIEATALALGPLSIPKLIDPVMVSRAGAVLLEPEAIQAYRNHLLPLADLLTPNLHEAGLLSDLPIASASDVERAAAVLREQGVAAVLVKGGGLAELRGRDYLLAGEHPGRWLVGAVIDTAHTHGSGCTLGAAITAYRARGLELVDAVLAAKTYVEGGLRHALAIGGGQGPLCHWHPLL
jgi:hydroxymethylpyrimidine/phosphomethylpyrimidine kinase